MDEKFLVTQSNKLIQARHTKPLSSREQKIVLTMVSMIQPQDEDFKSYEISVKEFSEMLALEGSVKYTQMKKIAEDLMSKTIEIPEEDGWLLANWVSSVRYKKGEGIISLSFSPELKPYMLQLKDQFTSYRLSNILNLRSTYAIRLYELMKRWQHLGRWECPIDDLKVNLGAVAKSHAVYGNFKSKALLPALIEVNEKTDLHIEFKEIKKGRAVARIEFSIKHLKEKEIRLPDPVGEKKPNMKQVEFDLLKEMNKRAVRNGQRYTIDNKAFNTLRTIANEIYSADAVDTELLSLVQYVNEATTAVENPLGFMIAVLKGKKEDHAVGINPSVGQMELFTAEGREIIPDWFADRQKEKSRSEEVATQVDIEAKRAKLQKELDDMAKSGEGKSGN